MIIENDFIRWAVIIGSGFIGGPIVNRYLGPGFWLFVDDTRLGLRRLFSL